MHNSIIFLTISDQLLQSLKERIKSFQNLGGDVKNNNIIKDSLFNYPFLEPIFSCLGLSIFS